MTVQLGLFASDQEFPVDEETQVIPPDDGTPCLPMGPTRITVMYRMYGVCRGHHCGECKSFQRFRQGARWAKCKRTKQTGGRGTDWQAKWTACGLFGEAER